MQRVHHTGQNQLLPFRAFPGADDGAGEQFLALASRYSRQLPGLGLAVLTIGQSLHVDQQRGHGIGRQELEQIPPQSIGIKGPGALIKGGEERRPALLAEHRHGPGHVLPAHQAGFHFGQLNALSMELDHAVVPRKSQPHGGLRH